jgi:hypothetical protein
MRNNLFGYAAVFVFTALPPFWAYTIGGTPLRFYLWLIPLVVFWLGRRFWERPTDLKN